MANMTFGVNILPSTTDTYNMGNSDKKWNMYANTLNGKDASSIPTAHTYTATIPTTGWTTYGSTDLKTVTVTVSGLTASDNGMVGLVQTGTESTDSAVREAFGAITRITTAANSITVYASAVPEVAIPIQIEVFR